VEVDWGGMCFMRLSQWLKSLALGGRFVCNWSVAFNFHGIENGDSLQLEK